MKVANLAARILARLQGRSIACDTREEVTALLAEQLDRLHDERLPAHLVGAARLQDLLAYQPGLVTLRGEAYDSALYLEGLLTAARTGGHTDLAAALEAAAEAMHDATGLLTRTVYATVPAPEVPLTQVA